MGTEISKSNGHAKKTPQRRRKPGTPKGRTFADLQRHRIRRAEALLGIIRTDLQKFGPRTVAVMALAQEKATAALAAAEHLHNILEGVPAELRPKRVATNAALEIGQKMKLVKPAEYPRIDASVLEVLAIAGAAPNLRYEMGTKEIKGGAKILRSYGFVPRNAMVPA